MPDLHITGLLRAVLSELEQYRVDKTGCKDQNVPLHIPDLYYFSSGSSRSLLRWLEVGLLYQQLVIRLWNIGGVVTGKGKLKCFEYNVPQYHACHKVHMVYHVIEPTP
jgi:hypothetical protein